MCHIKQFLFKSMVVLAIAHAALSFAQQPLNNQSDIQQFKLLIYYGYPSLITINTSANPIGNLAGVSHALAEYDVIVLGGGLESPSHPDFNNTLSIITQVHQLRPSTQIFGYIDLGVATSNFTIAQMEANVLQWKTMGVDGIFWDDAGYDYNNTRARQTTMIQYARNLGLSSFMNAWNPDDIFSSQVNATSNPTGSASILGPNDWFLLESLPFNSQAYASNGGWITPATLTAIVQKAQNYRALFGTRIAAASVVDYSSLTIANKQYVRNITQAVGFACSFDAYGDCALSYSASGANANRIFKGWWDLEMGRFGAQAYSLLNLESATALNRHDYETAVFMNGTRWSATTPFSTNPQNYYS